MVQLLQLQGVTLHVYLQNLLIHASCLVQARWHSDLALCVLQHLGWVINFSKSDLVHNQLFNFIGLQFSICSYIMAPLPRMQVKIQNTLDNWRSNPSITARNVHGILGLLTFMATLVPWGQMHLHRIKWWATEAWCQEVGFWSNQITVTPTILHQVAQWASPAIFQTFSLSNLGWVGLWGFLWWAPSAKRKEHHGVSSGWSSTWFHSNTGLFSTQYKQIPIIFGVWPFWLIPFFFWSMIFSDDLST